MKTWQGVKHLCGLCWTTWTPEVQLLKLLEPVWHKGMSTWQVRILFTNATEENKSIQNTNKHLYHLVAAWGSQMLPTGLLSLSWKRDQRLNKVTCMRWGIWTPCYMDDLASTAVVCPIWEVDVHSCVFTQFVTGRHLEMLYNPNSF